MSRRNPEVSPASLRMMSSSPGNRMERTDRAVLWLLLVLGTLLMLVAAGSARGEESVTRTDRFTASLPAGSTLRIENVSGDLSAAPGPEFSAVATIVVAAPTKARAEEILGNVRLVQSRDGNVFSIEARWPESRWRFDQERRGRQRRVARCHDCRITARFDVTVPPGVTVVLETVNGDVRARNLGGDLELRTVNGTVEARGVRGSLQGETVNGNLLVEAAALPRGASIELKTVNGAVTLTLPKDARFDFSGSTLHGSIASTFALPRRTDASDEAELRRKGAEDRAVRKVIVREHGKSKETIVVDVKDLEREIERSMKDAGVEIREAIEDGVREGVRDGVRQGVEGGVRGGIRGVRAVRGLRILDPRRAYSGRVGDGGARVRLSALNGSIQLLASGTRPEDARPVVVERRSFVVTVPLRVRIPEVRIRIPEIKVVAPHPDFEVRGKPLVWNSDAPVLRGNVAGDFLSTGGTSSYRIGDVSGRVKIQTHAGEIVVASAGAGADVKTLGGDIRLGPVKGNLAAQTLAGDVRAQWVAGTARVETSGGDIRLGRVDGWLKAHTGGGDIVVPLVGGAVTAATAGGDVRIAVGARQLREGVSIVSGGGDVTLTLPSDFRGNVDLTV
ncbi:MAG: DUF4097 family beta strand repeat-containing protein, partial [Acidobacteriota bacterium]|nr:DUF4097 family beta strand repeat-containing protein [Acidobacteriota bacterium]